jgi:magnesium-protoporphyrin O-methyltransferase
MMSDTYHQRRSEIANYFDRTAADTWARLTSDAPVGRIRQTVRKGRDEMRNVLLSYLPEDLKGARVLDAGAGTGALAVALAERGADVVAIDLSSQLISVAEQRTPPQLRKQITYLAGDMLDPAHGRFDHIVAMDSLIHYAREDMLRILRGLAARTENTIAFTFAPRTALLAAMHRVGRLFPRANRSPAIEPQESEGFRSALLGATGMQPTRTRRVNAAFYISQSQELTQG